MFSDLSNSSFAYGYNEGECSSKYMCFKLAIYFVLSNGKSFNDSMESITNCTVEESNCA